MYLNLEVTDTLSYGGIDTEFTREGQATAATVSGAVEYMADDFVVYYEDNNNGIK